MTGPTDVGRRVIYTPWPGWSRIGTLRPSCHGFAVVKFDDSPAVMLVNVEDLEYASSIP